MMKTTTVLTNQTDDHMQDRIYKEAMENKSLKPLLSEYYEEMKRLDSIYGKIIGRYCQGLVPLLIRLENDYFENNIPTVGFGKVCIDLRDLKPGVAIRYCGRFYNMMYLSEEGDDVYITLAYGITEAEDIPWERFQTDGYTGEKAIRHEMTVTYKDMKNLMALACQLGIYFQDTDYSDEYFSLKNETLTAFSKIDKSKIDNLNYLINVFLVNIGKMHVNYDEQSCTHYYMLPDRISIRYYGRYHNCLIIQNDKAYLGYLRNDSDYLCEEMYGNDGYTTRFNDCGSYYQLMHKTDMGIHKDREQLYLALASLERICVNPIDIDLFDYIVPDDVTEQK